MAMNRNQAHLIVLSEDKATHTLATGFRDNITSCAMKIENFCRGWSDVIHAFENTWVRYLTDWPQAHLVILIDFDNQFAARLSYIQPIIPPSVAARVYILGSCGEAEDLKRQQGASKFEAIGSALADECRSESSSLWNSPQLSCNQAELQRLQQNVSPFLF